MTDATPIPKGAVRMLNRLWEQHGGDRVKVAETLAHRAEEIKDDHRFALLLALVLEDQPLRSSANSRVA